MAQKISDLTTSKALSGSEEFEINQTQSGVLGSYSVSAGAIKTFVESTSVVSDFKNQIINGDFPIWQRASTQTSSGYGSDDRWDNLSVSGSSKTHYQKSFTVGQTDVPGNPKYFSRTNFTTGSGAGDYVAKIQKIESVYTLAGQTATLSFYGRAPSGALNIATELFQNFGTGGSPSASVYSIGVTTHALTTSFQKFTVKVDIPSITGKSLGTNSDDYLGLVFWFDAGSDFNSRTNSLGNQSGGVDISHVQLEQGSVATQFGKRPIGIELEMCKRYYHEGQILFSGDVTDATNYYASAQFPVEMRGTPDITMGTVVQVNGFSAVGVPTASGATQKYQVVAYLSSTATVAGGLWRAPYTASKEL